MAATRLAVCILLLLLSFGSAETFILNSNKYKDSLTRSGFKRFLNGKGLKLTHQNIRGLNHNFDLLQELVSEHNNIDILSLSETHISNFQQENLERYDLNGFTFISKNRSDGKGGGVAFYINEHINFKRRENLETPHIESLWIEILIKHQL